MAHRPMARRPSSKTDFERAADIVRDAGGRIVGRTRLQKIAYLFELAGVGEGFSFIYKNFGPYSDHLALAIHNASLLGYVAENERQSTWGGSYSIFTSTGKSTASASRTRAKIAEQTVDVDAIELELAATTAYLASKGIPDAWLETELRKPMKSANGRLQNAKLLYQKLRQIQTPVRFPAVE